MAVNLSSFDSNELAGLGWSELKRLGTKHGLMEAQIDECLEKRSPKLALIELLQELRERDGGQEQYVIVLSLSFTLTITRTYLYFRVSADGTEGERVLWHGFLSTMGWL